MKTNLSKFLFLTTILALITLPCRAGLGETDDQCTKRYGKPVAFPAPTTSSDPCPRKTLYNQDELNILVGFIEDKVAIIVVTKKAEDPDFTDHQVRDFLEADAPELKWKKSSQPSLNDIWDRDDGAHAEFDPNARTLTITSKVYITLVGPPKKS